MRGFGRSIGPATVFLNGEKLGEATGGLTVQEDVCIAYYAASEDGTMFGPLAAQQLIDRGPAEQEAAEGAGYTTAKAAAGQRYTSCGIACSDPTTTLTPAAVQTVQAIEDAIDADGALERITPREPPCHCASPTVHEAGCEWKAWKDGQT